MPLEFTLFVDTDVPPSQLLAEVAQRNNLVAIATTKPSQARVESAHLLVTATARDARRRRSAETMFGLDASLDITFRLNRHDSEPGFEQLWRVVGDVLGALPCDAVLLNDTLEVAYLRRRDGTQIASDVRPWSDEELLALGPGWVVGKDPGPTAL